MKKIIKFLSLSILVSILSINLFANNHELVNIHDIDKSIIIDLKYATKNNFLNKKIYNSNQARLRTEVAQALVKAQKEFQQHGFAIKIWDAYRPFTAQEAMWKIMPDSRYVSNPKMGGRHTRGTAVDITLVDLKTGHELTMPTGFDDFSKKAHRDYIQTNSKVKSNIKLLDSIMLKHGFIGLPTEWWHYDYHNWQQYPVIK